MNLERLPIIGPAISRRAAAKAQELISLLPSGEVSDKGKKFFDSLGGILDIPSTSGLSNETTVSKKLLQANKEWVFRNNDVIAMEVSKMEFELYQIGLKDGEIVYNEVESHTLLDLLDRPNAETMKSDALYIIQSHKKLAGDAFWLKIRSGRKVVALRSLPPDKIKLNLQDPTNDDPTVIKNFEYHDVIDGQKVDVIYEPEDIIYIKKPNPNNYFRGYGTVEALAETIDVDNLTNLTTKNFFKKGAITNFVLSTEQKINDDQIKRIQAEMKQMYGGAQNAYRTMILGGGLTPSKLTFSNKDMEFLAQLAWYRDKIMVGFGNTLASLGMLDDVNRATHESSMIEWKRNTIKPDMDSIINALNEFLVPEFGSNLILGYVDPIPEDRTDDIAEATQLYGGGLIMRNEGRELLGYESVEGGDVFSAPMGSTAEPGAIDDLDNDEDVDAEIDEINEDQDEGGEGDSKSMKRIYRSKNVKFRKRKATEVPSSLAHLELKPLLRSRGVYLRQRQNKELKEAFKPIIEGVIAEHQKHGKKLSIDKAFEIAMAKKDNTDEYSPPAHTKYSADEIMAYYHKQIHSVEVIEQHFDAAIIKYMNYVHSKIFNTLESQIEAKKSWVAKDIYDDNEDDFMAQAQLDFTPLLENLGIIAGQDAYKMVGVKDPYLPTRDLKSLISKNVEKFTKSMLSTDREHITNIISNGIENGDSVVDIRNALTSDAELDYTKNQATRVTRTEVLRASNQSAIDAWGQSGVVEGKQWITAGADDECADYEGQVEMLDSNFYGDTDEFADGDPPLHPNCRCSLVPIVTESADVGSPSFLDDESGSLNIGEIANAGITTYHGEGGAPMSESPMLGDAFYVSRTKSTAEQFGDVSEHQLGLKDSEIFKINTDKEFDDFVESVIAKYPEMDINKAIPKYVMGVLKKPAAEVAESVDPLGGIAIYDKKYIPKNGKTFGGILTRRIKELEDQADKRRKDFKDLKNKYNTEKSDDRVYIKSLEKYLGISDEQD